ncbi:hypothetical protein PoB_002422800 [Plakobranchus ocellatus]|uniref:Uncharacterized protein n=1 Tax=Plakobranchus ocellatus TaxID=259542 RepID=A0AAV3ZTB3_9GAST|nr:hypothetical protein PoB_002422800 [Plakobranchus ocellatus]
MTQGFLKLLSTVLYNKSLSLLMGSMAFGAPSGETGKRSSRHINHSGDYVLLVIDLVKASFVDTGHLRVDSPVMEDKQPPLWVKSYQIHVRIKRDITEAQHQVLFLIRILYPTTNIQLSSTEMVYICDEKNCNL